MVDSKITETDFDPAWRVIRTMQGNSISDDWVVTVRMSCYLKKAEIAEHIAEYGYSLFSDIKKKRVPFPFNLLPVSKPYYFHLYDIKTHHIYDLAWSCNDFLMFEIFVADRDSIAKIGKEKFLKSEETLYADFESVKKQCEKYFFCGFDFDDPHFESGVSRVADYNFVPDALSLFFQ